MTEVVILELILDPSKMIAGAKAAGDALDGLGGKAQDTEKKFRASGSALSAAFQASGGSIQIAQGITSTAKAFGDLNTQAGLFGASRTILELGKTAQDFRNLGHAAGSVSGAFSLLTAAWKASPFGVIAGVIGIAAAAMSFFGSKTEETTKAIEKNATALDNWIARVPEMKLRAALGEEDPRKTVAGTINTIVSSTFDDPSKQYTATQVEDMYGLEPGKAEELYYRAYPNMERYRNRGNNPKNYLPPDVVGREYLKDLRATEARERAAADAKQRRGGTPESYDQDTRSGIYDKAVANAQKEMDILIAKGQQFGATIGDAFFNVASGAQSARQAIAGLISDMARAASREAFAGIFGRIAGGFGTTPAQAGANAISQMNVTQFPTAQ